jgi:hypothetical protein
VSLLVSPVMVLTGADDVLPIIIDNATTAPLIQYRTFMLFPWWLFIAGLEIRPDNNAGLCDAAARVAVSRARAGIRDMW